MTRSHLIRPKRSLATTDARTQLPQLVNELVAVEEPGATLADNAVEIGPRNRGGVWILPTVDVDAAIDREDTLRTRVDELEDEAENLAFGFFLLQRLDQSKGTAISGADFIRELGFDDLASDLP